MSINYDILDNYLARGLCAGEGEPEGQVCIEEAVCLAMGLPISDDPPCIAKSLMSYMTALNDCPWSSPKARAEGLRALSYAQIGTAGRLNREMFSSRLGQLTIRVLIPALFRDLGICKEAADRCERKGTPSAAMAAAACAAEARTGECGDAAWAAWAARAAACATMPPTAAEWAGEAATAAAWSEKAAEAVTDRDKFLKLSASLCLLALKEQGFVGERNNETN